MTKPDAEQIGPLAPNPVNLAIADAELQGYQPQEGDTVPRRILQAGDGSHADITAHGTEFNPDAADSSIGVWNVQLQRALDTGNADDIALVPGQVYEAGFEVHLWEYTTRDHYVSFPVTIGLGVEADIQAVDLTGTVDGGAESAAAINWDEIPKQRLYLFQPGITSWEFLTGENMTEGKQYLNVQAQLVDQTHGGSDAVNNGDACASCHTVREGDEGPATNFGAMETLAGQRGGIWENTPVVTVSGGNIAPTASAGADQAIVTGSVVTLDGSGSSDPDSDPLTYAWTLVAPAGSSAVLSDATIVNPTFTADVDGTYTATLVVNDGTDDSAPNDVVVTASPDEPVGVIADGQAKYDAACAVCHAAGSHDTTTAAGGNDLVADNSVIISDLASIDGIMASVSPLTAQEVLDLQAFLDSL
jgi:mono/diheme cytochrome c family protein